MIKRVKDIYLEIIKEPGVNKLTVPQVEALYRACIKIYNDNKSDTIENNIVKARQCLKNILTFNDPFNLQ